jgi:hypothetical protein
VVRKACSSRGGPSSSIKSTRAETVGFIRCEGTGYVDGCSRPPASKSSTVIWPTPITLQPCANLAINVGQREIQEQKETKTRTEDHSPEYIISPVSPHTLGFKPINNAPLASYFSPFNPRLPPPPQLPCLPPQRPPDPEAPRVPTHATATASSA